MESSGNYFITTAIDYVNALPHLGTAYEKIGADVMARFQRLRGRRVFFMMGTDEHSVNVEREAAKRNVPVRQYCDELAARFEEVWKTLGLSYDYFIRTSGSSHVRAVQHVFRFLYEKGDIYLGNYEGWYCNSCEAYLKDKDLAQGLCPTHRLKPEWIREKNYFFRLSRYQEDLKKVLRERPDFIQPRMRHNEIENVIEGGLEDISVSRSGVQWGIPLPFDGAQVVYVWFDALINYISGTGYPEDLNRFNAWWPAQTHVIGKDITRFHCVIWPAMLMSLGLALPQRVFAHGFVYLKGEKMSKTSGTKVGPVEAARKFGVDALRYFLMREIPFDRDGDFTWEAFEARYAADLANDLGNLVQRSLAMIARYHEGLIPKPGVLEDEDHRLVEQARSVVRDYGERMESFSFSDALVRLWDFIRSCNTYVAQMAPWSLAKDSTQAGRLGTVLYVLAESIAKIALLIEPFMPRTAAKIREQLGIDASLVNFQSLEEWGQLKPGTKLGPVEPLFPKVEK